MKSIWIAFFAGCITQIGWYMLDQDMLGKAQFLAVAAAGWVNTPLWFDALVIGFGLALWLSALSKHKQETGGK